MSKRDKKKVEIILKKMEEIIKNPHHYKNLRTPMEDFKRVHIDKSFVLIFTVDDNKKRVIFVDFAHPERQRGMTKTEVFGIMMKYTQIKEY